MVPVDFGGHLKEWRRRRGLSQLDLALQADVSQRHISFIETGRSRPSREMVLHLGQALEVPPREQNVLLLAAGHAPAYSETPLDQIEEISRVLDVILEAHEPAMAIVVDRQWNVIRSNTIATSFISSLFPDPPEWMARPPNVMRLNFHPEGLRRHMVDWEITAAALLRRLERDVRTHPSDTDLADLLEEVHSYPGVSSLPGPAVDAGSSLLVPATYVIDGNEISLFTTIARIGDAHDLTLAELRLETFWPVDPTSSEHWTRLVSAFTQH